MAYACNWSQFFICSFTWWTYGLLEYEGAHKCIISAQIIDFSHLIYTHMEYSRKGNNLNWTMHQFEGEKVSNEPRDQMTFAMNVVPRYCHQRCKQTAKHEAPIYSIQSMTSGATDSNYSSGLITWLELLSEPCRPRSNLTSPKLIMNGPKMINRICRMTSDFLP